MKMFHSLQSLMAFAPYSLLVSKLPDSLHGTPATPCQGLPFSSKTKNALHAKKRALKGLKNNFLGADFFVPQAIFSQVFIGVLTSLTRWGYECGWILKTCFHKDKRIHSTKSLQTPIKDRVFLSKKRALCLAIATGVLLWRKNLCERKKTVKPHNRKTVQPYNRTTA